MRKQTKILLARRGIFALLILAAYLVQSAVGGTLEIFGVRAWFLLTFTVCLGLFERETAGAAFGLFAGALWDFMSPTGGGSACGILINTIMRNNLVTALLLNSIAHLLYISLYIVFFVLAEGVDSAGWLFVRYYLPSAVFSVLFTPVIYLLVRAVMNRTKLRR